ncbi:hypothetical protein [Methanobrevibacter millerae]|uniref:Uncharacterized protein n=1 Tax=Methanobrevibacter millerae TaxID=230361 RepID=A0A1G5VZF3_9EURY|nr:hypothetical protein [Methanobrevibacter millerae]SDA51094.1 hypothetical protein SAMN02910315_01035 [Methanobrevibacter millerae]
MDLYHDINWKSLIIGAAITAGTIIIAAHGYEWLFLFSAIGLLYVGYEAKNIKYGIVLGAIASTPIVYLALDGTLGAFSGFFATEIGVICFVIIILLVGAFVSFVGAWAKRSREKAKVEYEKKQKIGKNKKKK